MFKMFKQMRKINKSKLSNDEWYATDENGRGIIDVGAENYDDIFSYYDLDGENVLDNEFVEFLETKADAVPLKQELAIHFHVQNPTEEKREEIERAVKNHYKREIKALNRKLHRISMFSLYLLLMSLVFLAIYIPLELLEVHFVLIYVFDIATWVFIWEAVDQWFIHRREIKQEMLIKFRFIRSDIDVYKYESKKKKEFKLGNKVKYLNKILKHVDNKPKIKKNSTDKSLKKQEKINNDNS